MGTAIAYFITWTCYGTRLHGDARGTVDDSHNAFGAPTIPDDPLLQSGIRFLLAEAPWTMSAEDRLDVRVAMMKTAEIRKWRITRVNVRTNHVHVVVQAPGEQPEHVAAIFKTWATRALKSSGRHPGRTKFWTNQASTRHLFDDNDMFEAFEYVVDQ
jgi:REP element-mobilizing transposase RayT